MTVHVTAPMLAAYQHFISVGFIENGAGAAVGNFCQESGELLIATMFREHPDYSGGVPDALKSGGIAEWLGDRKTAYIAFSGRSETRLGLSKGSLLNDLGTQCDFVVYELQTTPEYTTLYKQLTSGSRSVANLTANFMMVYERPKLGPTAGLDNRIAHAEAVVARARELKVPQQATHAPVPQAQPPSVPIPVPVPSPATAAPSQISATIAGLDAAILDHFAAIRDALINQRDAINVRIAKIEAQASDFAKLEGPETLVLSPIIQKPAVEPVAITTQGNQKVLGLVSINWKTTVSGIVAAAAQGIGAKYPEWNWLTQYVTAGAMAALGLSAKDSNVTGGSVSNVTGATSAPVSLIDKQK